MVTTSKAVISLICTLMLTAVILSRTRDRQQALRKCPILITKR
jgi:hypothetical protein